MTEEATQENSVNLTVHNIYVKDVSFEAPSSPQVFALEWKPQLNFDIQMARTAIEGDLYEVVMTITVTVTMAAESDEAKTLIAENQTAFIVEVKQAGIFMLQNSIDAEQIDYILSTAAPTILFPYAREAVSNLVSKGGFPQLIIPPMNFEAMYQQHLVSKQQESEMQIAHA